MWPGSGTQWGVSAPNLQAAFAPKSNAINRADVTLEQIDALGGKDMSAKRLFMLYIDEVDQAGHRKGPRADKTRTAAELADAAVGDGVEQAFLPGPETELRHCLLDDYAGLRNFGLLDHKRGPGHGMIVRVDDPSGELATCLVERIGEGGEALVGTGAPLGFDTVIGGPAHHERPVQSKRRPVFNEFSLLRVLVVGINVVAPLRKRAGAGKPFSERVSAGRARNNDIVLRDESVSKFHAYLTKRGEVWWVHDQGSTNGTFVDKKKIDAKGVAVDNGSRVAFGQKMRFRFYTPAGIYSVLTGK